MIFFYILGFVTVEQSLVSESYGSTAKQGFL